MPLSIVEVYHPNDWSGLWTPVDTEWQLLCIHPTTKATSVATSYSARAAGTNAYPGLLNNAPIGSMLIRSVTAAGTGDGSAFAYFLQGDTAPGAMEGLVSGAGQQVSVRTPAQRVWVKLTAASDRIAVSGAF